MNNEGRKARTEDTEWQPKVRPRAMLTKLVVRFDPDQYRVRESASGLAAPFDDEHEDEIEKDHRTEATVVTEDALNRYQ